MVHSPELSVTLVSDEGALEGIPDSKFSLKVCAEHIPTANAITATIPIIRFIAF
jgi:hypothetical protein